MSVTSDRIRKEFKEGDDIRDAGLKTPKDIERQDDIVYGSNPDWNVLDIYRPANEAGKMLPVIISVHGGAWVYGDKERYQYYCMSLAQRGFAVVNFTYRLAPEYKFPAPLEDTNAVMQWVLQHAMEYGMDTGHIYMVGDSAGGNILALYTEICTNPSYAVNYSLEVPQGFAPKAVALNCASYFIDVEKEPRKKKLMEDYMPEKGTKEEIDLISPILHVTEQFPPAFLMTANGDYLREQAPLMAEKLKEKHVPFEYHCYGDASEELQHVFHCNMKLKAASVCNDAECEFFNKWR